MLANISNNLNKRGGLQWNMVASCRILQTNDPIYFRNHFVIIKLSRNNLLETSQINWLWSIFGTDTQLRIGLSWVQASMCNKSSFAEQNMGKHSELLYLLFFIFAISTLLSNPLEPPNFPPIQLHILLPPITVAPLTSSLALCWAFFLELPKPRDHNSES